MMNRNVECHNSDHCEVMESGAVECCISEPGSCEVMENCTSDELEMTEKPVFHPHDYQQYSIEFLLTHPVACLFLDMGLGKTAITLFALMYLLFERFEVSRVLIIGPLRVIRDTWVNEVKKWAQLEHIDFIPMVGTEKERIAALNSRAFIFGINRENVKWLISYYERNGLRWDFDMVVIDELSSFKNHQSQRFKALKKVRPHIKRFLGLTGTPASNGLIDLWSEVGIVDGFQRLGRFFTHYRDAYFAPASMNPQTGIVYRYAPRAGVEDIIYGRIADITVSMKAVDHLDMPEIVYVDHKVQMSPAEQRLYEMLKEDFIIPLGDSDIEASGAGVLCGKLLQMSNGAVYDTDGKAREIHNQKLLMLEDLIEAANGQSVLIAYWFKHDRDRIIKHLTAAGYNPTEIKSSQDINNWNNGQIPVALIHPASAGHGLNIQQGGHILIWFGLTWSLELYQQTNARLWRQGQTEVVTIHHIITAGTVDKDVLRALKDKDVTQERLIKAVKAELGYQPLSG